ncbi:MAG: hypothetical protein N4J56_002913 [Chroococcidiopsis sp. SAG 2025]|nr:hypothetical protein [Chroococcidiopsis sp. SAG 2025]
MFYKSKTEIESRLDRELASIGQTWMLSGWLPNDPLQNEDIVLDCYYALFQDKNWQQKVEVLFRRKYF